MSVLGEESFSNKILLNIVSGMGIKSQSPVIFVLFHLLIVFMDLFQNVQSFISKLIVSSFELPLVSKRYLSYLVRCFMTISSRASYKSYLDVLKEYFQWLVYNYYAHGNDSGYILLMDSSIQTLQTYTYFSTCIILRGNKSSVRRV